MIHEDIELTGSFTVTGSFILPNHPSSASISNPTTGSMYNDTTDNVVKLYNGTEWVVVGSQTGSAGGGGGADMEYLLVGGGGGNPLGGNNGAGNGGGGGGGFISSSYSNVTSGSSFTITIGAGTTTSGGDTTIASDTFANQTAVGGGEGGSGRYSQAGSGTTQTGKDGGSGGGGGNASSGDVSGGAATTGQGNDGGSGVSNEYAGGGGGGAGAAGGNASSSTGGNGGDGKQSSITGTATYYAGGGGGGTYGGTAGTGGAGGGTDGKNYSGGQPSDGTANTGGGAGGLANKALSAPSGGSGIAIFSYNTGSLSGLGGIKTLNGGKMVHTFKSSGTLTISSAGDYPVAPSSVFAPVLYTGTGAAQSITSLNFQPDLVWIKNRDAGGTSHKFFDSIRGATKFIESDTTDGEGTNTNTLTSFDSNGFSIGSAQPVNQSGQDIVAWCWKAGGTAVSNTDGSITSNVSANAEAGFSIVSYDGATNSTSDTSTNGGTYWNVGHGLSQAPELVIVKCRDAAHGWYVGADVLNSGDWTSNHHLILQNNTAVATVSTTAGILWGNQNPTSTTFGVGGWDTVNRNGLSYIAYCFHSIDGYQKVGSYTGNGTDLSITGFNFSPRFLMLKRTDSTGNWVVFDSVRGEDEELYPNLSNAESNEPNRTSLDSDGFTVRNGRYNNSGGTFIYLAIA